MYGIFTYIYPKQSTIYVGKYASPMDPMGGLSTSKTLSDWKSARPRFFVIGWC